MKERYIKIDDWYLPISGIMFQVYPDGWITIFEMGRDEVLRSYQGKQAEEIKQLLDAISFDLTIEREDN